MIMRFDNEVSIPVGNTTVTGELIIPQNATAIIIFSHGSGSSRLSKRNQQVAAFLREKNFGTLLFDLLTPDEDLPYYNNRFNIDLLANRLADVTRWLEFIPAAGNCHVGIFGASTGAAAALQAAAITGGIEAVVSRGGRPDLAMKYLPVLKVPILLIVGSLDYDVLQLNNKAYAQLNCEKKLVVVEGATHLFEEPGCMEEVAELAAGWFQHHLHPIKA